MSSRLRIARERIRCGNFIVPSPEEIESAKTDAGGWTAIQLAEWGVSWPPPYGWRWRLHRLYLHHILVHDEIIRGGESGRGVCVICGCPGDLRIDDLLTFCCDDHLRQWEVDDPCGASCANAGR